MKLPHILKYSDSVKGGTAKMFKITINEDLKDDKGLYLNEYEHIKQQYMFFVPLAVIALLVFYFYRQDVGLAIGTFSVLAKDLCSNFIRPVRKKLEIDSTVAQLTEYFKDPSRNKDHLFKWASESLASDTYKLKMTPAEIEIILRRKVPH